jgi:hypothetical protein
MWFVREPCSHLEPSGGIGSGACFGCWDVLDVPQIFVYVSIAFEKLIFFMVLMRYPNGSHGLRLCGSLRAAPFI